MPNLVRNILTVEKKHLSYLLNSENQMDFEIVVPMPSELIGTNAERDVDIACIYAVMSMNGKISIKKLTDIVKSPKPKTLTRETSRIIKIQNCYELLNSYALMRLYPTKDCLELAKSYYESRKRMLNTRVNVASHVGKLYARYFEYGSTNEYDWRMSHWGCKWNANHIDIKDNANYVDIIYDTAWHPPVAYLKQLSQRNIKFTNTWFDEAGHTGWISNATGSLNIAS